MKTLKGKLIVSNILLCTAIFMLVATTIAYFTAQRQMSATLTSGNVKIALSEAAVKSDGKGNLIEDPDAARIFGTPEATVHDYGMVYPGQTIFKDPTIRNTGSNDAFIAAKVVFEDGAGDLHKIYGYPESNGIDIELLLKGALLDEKINVGWWNGHEEVCHNDRYAMIQVAEPHESKYTFYFLFSKPFQQNETEMLFDTLYIDEFLSGHDLQELRDLKITVQAFGVQTYGFESCYQAMTTAFPTHFTF